jgi:hypothetical protein
MIRVDQHRNHTFPRFETGEPTSSAVSKGESLLTKLPFLKRNTGWRKLRQKGQKGEAKAVRREPRWIRLGRRNAYEASLSAFRLANQTPRDSHATVTSSARIKVMTCLSISSPLRHFVNPLLLFFAAIFSDSRSSRTNV